tara:strand:- start:1325 stop:1783 length:459 start_codon:yes stop_codon:yes gene_type:complete
MMQSQKAILAVLLIFGAGLVAGYVIGRQAVPRPQVDESRSKEVQVFRLDVGELSQRLNLTTDQEDQVRTVYAESQKRLKGVLSEDIRRNVREEVALRDEKIRAILYPLQIKKYDQLPGMRRPTGKPTSAPPIQPLPEGGNETLPLPEVKAER